MTCDLDNDSLHTAAILLCRKHVRHERARDRPSNGSVQTCRRCDGRRQARADAADPGGCPRSNPKDLPAGGEEARAHPGNPRARRARRPERRSPTRADDIASGAGRGSSGLCTHRGRRRDASTPFSLPPLTSDQPVEEAIPAKTRMSFQRRKVGTGSPSRAIAQSSLHRSETNVGGHADALHQDRSARYTFIRWPRHGGPAPTSIYTMTYRI